MRLLPSQDDAQQAIGSREQLAVRRAPRWPVFTRCLSADSGSTAIMLVSAIEKKAEMKRNTTSASSSDSWKCHPSVGPRL